METREDKKILSDCFGKSHGTGTRVEIGDGIYAEQGLLGIRKAFGVPQVVNILIEYGETVALSVASGVAATWLYDKLKNRDVVKLEIEGKEVEVDKEEIRKRLERSD